MKLYPTPETKATPEVKAIYEELKVALNLPNVPLFFQFLGSFPDYLVFLSESINSNLNSPKYIELVAKNSHFVKQVFRDSFPKDILIQNFLTKYQNTPELYNLKEELGHIFETNAKLVFIFLALREAVKGWAVAARKLSSHFETSPNSETAPNIGKNFEEQFIYNTDLLNISHGETEIAASGKSLVPKSTGLSQALLPQYLNQCELEFKELLKTEALLFFRVELERIALRNLDLLPFPIFSPINVVLEIAKKYPNFPDLLYLLCEHFPTYAVQRYLFSAYMLY